MRKDPIETEKGETIDLVPAQTVASNLLDILDKDLLVAEFDQMFKSSDSEESRALKSVSEAIAESVRRTLSTTVVADYVMNNTILRSIIENYAFESVESVLDYLDSSFDEFEPDSSRGSIRSKLMFIPEIKRALNEVYAMAYDAKNKINYLEDKLIELEKRVFNLPTKSYISSENAQTESRITKLTVDSSKTEQSIRDLEQELQKLLTRQKELETEIQKLEFTGGLNSD